MPTFSFARFIQIAAGTALLAASAAAGSAVSVHFENPAQYTDASLGAGQAAEPRVLAIIEDHLQNLGQRCLSGDAALEVRVLDIDLAGRQQWSRQNLRVMRESDWPRIDIAYALRRSGADVAAGRQQVSDMNYLWTGSAAARSDTQPMPYERAMLTRWFNARFCG
ncbi:MAG TPA: DUF3016 domain-containing protein [Noviherbaspirillum sp.]|jgi:hypothetical protein|uniref:DUF3016 domain-containing protein n=1 Tax=Noviherbaspirillum sp. TaxID=1926288 RepID=UPI002F949C25